MKINIRVVEGFILGKKSRKIGLKLAKNDDNGHEREMNKFEFKN